MRTTIRQVATRLGLSITTVSRALDGYDDVAENTRELVKKTAEEMGYIPNRAARQLRRQRTETIGYILPGIKTGFTDPFFSEFIAGLGDEVAAQDYDLLISSAPPATSEEKKLYQRWIREGKVDGMVINRISLNDWRLNYLADENTPHVSLERPSTLSKTYCVETDCQQGYYELVSTLIKNGFENFVYIGGPTYLKIDKDRHTWIENAISREGKGLDSNNLFQSDLTREGGYVSARKVLGQINPPLAMICINDLTAIGAMHACIETGMKIGQNVAICGYDGIPEVAYSHPPLTTFEQPVYDIARILTRMLISIINKEKPEEITFKISPKVIFRASTGSMKT